MIVPSAARHLIATPARRRVVAEDVVRILDADLPWGDLDGKVILISGANGFLATYLIEAMLGMRAALGVGPARMIGIVRTRANAEARFAHHAGRDDLLFIEASVEDNFAVDGPVDFIVHAASPASSRFYLTDPVGVMKANLDGTRNLLDLARCKNSRFLFVSSGEVYGQTERVPTGEADYGFLEPATVRSCYGESKRAGETMCVCWGHQYGLQVSIVRPFHTYGPGLALDDGRVFADFVADIVAGRDIVVRGDGLATRAFCYVTDAIAGFLTILLKGETATPYNIGNQDAEISMKDLAETLVGLFPAKGLKVAFDTSERTSAYAVSPIARNAPDITRARKLGWSPTTTIPEGFARMVKSYD